MDNQALPISPQKAKLFLADDLYGYILFDTELSEAVWMIIYSDNCQPYPSKIKSFTPGINFVCLLLNHY